MVPCLALNVVSWPAFTFLRRQVRWSGIPISWRIFQFFVIHTVKAFSVVNEAEVGISLEFSCFFGDPTDVGNLISSSSVFYKSRLNIWKLLVHVLLKPHLENSEHYLASMWNEGNYVVIWTWHCLSLGLEWKLTFSSPVVTAEFSKFASISSAVL